jgi:hypothetical protein
MLSMIFSGCAGNEMITFFTVSLDDTEKPADGGQAEGGPADGVLSDELKAMSLDSGSSTDADVDSDSGSWFGLDIVEPVILYAKKLQTETQAVGLDWISGNRLFCTLKTVDGNSGI